MDIFGKTVSDYKTLSKFKEKGILDQQLRARCDLVASYDRIPKEYAMKKHNFQAYTPGQLQVRQATAGSYGYIMDNFQAFTSMTEEIWYREDVLEQYVPVMVGGISEGATSYAVVVKDRVGRGRLASRAGSNPPTAGGNRRKYSTDLHLGVIVAEYTDEDVRNSVLANLPIREEHLSDAVKGAYDHLETVGLMGDPDIPGTVGLLNQPFTGTNATAQRVLPAGAIVQGLQASDSWIEHQPHEQIAVMQYIIGQMITRTQTAITRMPGDLIIALPPELYAHSGEARSNNSDLNVLQYLKMSNAWTDATGREVQFKMLNELNTAGTAARNSSTKRIMFYLKSPDIMEMRLVFAPRITRVVQKEYSTCLPLEYKYSTFQVKRKDLIYYYDDI